MARGAERYAPGHSEDREHATLRELDVRELPLREADVSLNATLGSTISKTTHNYEGGSQVRGTVQIRVL